MRDAIQRSSVNRPKGKLEGGDTTITVSSNDQLFDADAFRGVVVAYRNGAAVHLSDIAEVADGVENDLTTGWYNGTILNHWPYSWHPTTYPEYAQDSLHGYSGDAFLEAASGVLGA